MGFHLPWAHGYTPSAPTVEGTELAYDDEIGDTDAARLLPQFRAKPRIAGLVRLLCGARLQRLEIALWQCLVERRLGTAVGAQLDVLARVVGIERQGRSDAKLRRVIAAVVLVLRSSGSPDELIRIARAFLGADVVDGTSSVVLEELAAAIEMTLIDVDPFDALELARLLFRAKPSGVHFGLQWTEDETEAFTLSSTSSEVASEAKGFGTTTDATIGGRLAGVFSGR